MFGTIEIPFESVMMANIVKLKEGATIEDAQMALGEMCNVAKNTYGNEEGGFIAGQIFNYDGVVSDEGSVGQSNGVDMGDHLLIVTYWRSFEQHEKSHADITFKEKFAALAELCAETSEFGYELVWQGVPE